MKRPTLTHPSRAVLVHIPTAVLDHLDSAARASNPPTTRSELIRRLVMAPMEKVAPNNVMPEQRATQEVKPASGPSFKEAWARMNFW